MVSNDGERGSVGFGTRALNNYRSNVVAGKDYRWRSQTVRVLSATDVTAEVRMPDGRERTADVSDLIPVGLQVAPVDPRPADVVEEADEVAREALGVPDDRELRRPEAGGDASQETENSSDPASSVSDIMDRLRADLPIEGRPSPWLDRHRDDVMALQEKSSAAKVSQFLGIKQHNISQWRSARAKGQGVRPLNHKTKGEKPNGSTSKTEKSENNQTGSAPAAAAADQGADANYWRGRCEGMERVLELLTGAGAVELSGGENCGRK